MAKQNGGKPQIDEDFMKEIISQGLPVKKQETPTITVKTEIETPDKPDDKAGSVETVDKPEIKAENILLRHFDQFQDEINELYESKFEKPF